MDCIILKLKREDYIMSRKDLYSGSDEDYAIKERFQREMDNAGDDSYKREEVRKMFRDEMDSRFPDNEQAEFLKNNYFK